MSLLLLAVLSVSVSCRVVSCRVVSCRVVSCRVVSCRVVSCRVVSLGWVCCPVAITHVVLGCVVTDGGETETLFSGVPVFCVHMGLCGYPRKGVLYPWVRTED